MTVVHAPRALIVGTIVLVTLVSGCTPGEPSPPTSGPVDCPAEPDTVAREVRYRSDVAGVDPDLVSLDLYEPTRPAGCPAAAIVVYVHGGGFRIGDKANRISDKARLFTSSGHVFASVNYRLVGDARSGPAGATFPRHAQDVAAAIAWLANAAPGLRAAASRIVVMGHSAGAFLAAQVAADPSCVRSAGADPGGLVCAVSLDTEGFDIATRIGSGTSPGAALDLAAFGSDPAVWEAASPLTHVGDRDAPADTLLVTRGSAARRRGNQVYAQALDAAGGTATVLGADPLSHEEVNAAVGAPGDTVVTPTVVEFVERCTEPPTT